MNARVSKPPSSARAAFVAGVAIVLGLTGVARAQTTELVLHPDFGGAVGGVGGVFTLGEAEGLRPPGSDDRFHVFDRFNVAAGDTVEWVGPGSTRNVFNLVTGGEPSTIDGLLRSTLDADIYFVNPEGILFGEGAQLDLAGSFFASTADRLDFDDGENLALDLADGPSVLALSVADFEAFGFLDANESIDIDGAMLGAADDAVLGFHAARHVRVDAALDTTPAELRAGRVELTTEFGDVRLRGGRVFAERGAVAGGSGVVVTSADDLEVTDGSGIESEGTLGVVLTARTIEVDEIGSEVVSRAADVVGGNVDLFATGRISIRDGARVASEATGTGLAGDVQLDARDLLLLNASIETTSEAVAGGQGAIDVDIDRVINLVDGRIESDIPQAGEGDVSIAAPLVVLQDDARIASGRGALDIETDLLVRSAEAELEGQPLSISGALLVRNLQADLNERLEMLPQRFFEERIRLDRSCAARSGEAQGSLIVDAQRVPEDRPDRLRRALYATKRAALRDARADAATADWNPFPEWFGAIPEPGGDDWLFLAQRGEALGNLPSAVAAAGQGIQRTRDARLRAALHAVRARIRSELGDERGAREDFTAAEAFVREAADPALEAAVALDRATAIALGGDFDAAIAQLDRPLELARRTAATSTAAAAEANLASVLLAAGRTGEAIERIEHYLKHDAQALVHEHEIDSAIHVALAAIRAGERQWGADRLIALAERGLALEIDHSVAFAWAYLAILYAEEGRLADAIELTRWAIEASLASDELTRLAPLEVQLADLLRRVGDLPGAIRSYRTALLATPLLVRGGLRRLERDPFANLHRAEAAMPVVNDLVDVLLEQAEQTLDPDARADLLREARSHVEAERVRELRDHFQDPCIVALEKRPADSIPRAVVVHPVPLADRLALIVSSVSGLRTYDVPVSRGELLDVVRRTERALRDRTTNRFRRGAAQLYDWLIRPIETELEAADVDTLVFVAGGGLRGFPMAALYDAREGRFLIEKIAVAATPGLTLIRPRSLDPRALVVLRAGLDIEREGVPELPSVERELEALSRLFSGVELRGDSFVPRQVERALRNASFDVVHIASHGRFPASGEAPHLMTAGEALSLDDLAAMIRRTRFRDRPTELITLSACETAVGNERAALGFAGLAIQSGARSTLATLWRVNDEASAELMEDFYRALATGEATRAGALREAQLRFLENPVLRHPYFWAPYLLLGNWQ